MQMKLSVEVGNRPYKVCLILHIIQAQLTLLTPHKISTQRLPATQEINKCDILQRAVALAYSLLSFGSVTQLFRIANENLCHSLEQHTAKLGS